MANLGRLERVDLRHEWPSEAGDFTPWLAEEANLVLLGETVGIELELEAQERAVGPFRADILCKDMGNGHWVLIENQLERTDHLHLGQLLTYAAGLSAVTIIWVAARFTDEHRAALDWLNGITNDTFRFFGIEVELWRIGDSLAAPKFNIISKPNNWSKAVQKAARSIDDEALGDTQLMRLAYWEALHDVLNERQGPISGLRKPQPNNWMDYSVGRAGFSCRVSISRFSRDVQVSLYLSNTHAPAHFEQLRAQRLQIEHDITEPLEWPDMEGKQHRRVFIALPVEDFADRTDWPRQHAWVADHLNRFHEVFAPRVRRLENIEPE